MGGYLQVVTTVGDAEEARRIAAALVERRLAACVQISGPITSVYRWQGQLESSEEWYCVAKTRNDCFDRLAAAIRELHSYDVPEILAMRIEAGDPAYLAWVDEGLAEPDDDSRGTY